MRSILRRLEILEAQSQQSVILLVTFRDGHTEEMGISEFKELAKDRWADIGSIRILSGGVQRELKEYMDTNMKVLGEVLKHPAENRSVEDFE